MELPKRQLGKTGVEVTIVGLGGEGVLRTFGYDAEAEAVINRALDLGINYCESARAYDGSESYYGRSLKERRSEVFLTSKSHGRSRKEAEAHLAETLRNMRTDYLDLWQVHDVRTEAEIEEIFGPGGAIEAFAAAKQQGRVRFVGVTGHHDPYILRRCLEIFPFDTVLMPVNPAEPHDRSFLDIVLPAARQKGLGIVAMKTFFRGYASLIPGYVSMEPFFRYALSQQIATAVIGCDSPAHVEENVRFAVNFRPMEADEERRFVGAIGPYAGQLMYYKPH